jgi:Zn-finger nucleic acid-binding protein
MKCPVCNVDLKSARRQSIEIHYCPHCQGLWLARGDLDKVLERSSRLMSESVARHEPHGDYEVSTTHGKLLQQKKPGKHHSFLEELFSAIE